MFGFNYTCIPCAKEIQNIRKTAQRESNPTEFKAAVNARNRRYRNSHKDDVVFKENKRKYNRRYKIKNSTPYPQELVRGGKIVREHNAWTLDLVEV